MPITSQEANDIRARSDAFAAWLGNRRSYRDEDVPADVPRVTNDETSALEVFDFVNDPPARYFLYINETTCKATTWTGDVLGDVTFGRAWRANMGDARVSIRIRAINGRTYAGTYYKSAGDYARVKAMRRKG